MIPFNLTTGSTLAPGGSSFAAWGIMSGAIAVDQDVAFISSKTGTYKIIGGVAANTLTTATTRIRLRNLTQATMVEVTLAAGAAGPTALSSALSANLGDDMVIEVVVDAGGAGAIAGPYGGVLAA